LRRVLHSIELLSDLEEGGFNARVRIFRRIGEGETENEAIDDLKEAFRGYVETFGLDDALSRLAQPALRTIDLDLAELARG
jgi:predicted RNase H-like HicB family nuclease